MDKCVVLQEYKGGIIMIKHNGETKVDHVEKMRGGAGTVIIDNLLEKEKNEFNGKGRLFAKITVKPGCSVGYHMHEGETETYYIVSGKGVFNDNGVIKDVVAGDVTVTVGGQGHGMENKGVEDLVMMALILFD
jgi:mannose-6-phosphate isomerase-like protein (cupin superfamily)